MSGNPYARLGVPENATPEEIQRARRTLAAIHHPDLHGGSAAHEDALKQINADADELLDPVRRTALDARFKDERDRASAAEAAKTSRQPATSPQAPGVADVPVWVQAMKPIFEATPVEDVAKKYTAEHPPVDGSDAFWHSAMRGVATAADVAWKVAVASSMHRATTPRRRAPVLVQPTPRSASRRCRARTTAGRRCRNYVSLDSDAYCAAHGG